MTSVRVNLKITDKTIDDIIMMAIPAMRFWCNNILYISRYSGSIHKSFGSPHEPEEIGRLLLGIDANKVMIQDKNTQEFHHITRKKIVKGIKKFFTDWTIESESLPHIDEEIAHKIIQYALFDHIRYNSHGKEIS